MNARQARLLRMGKILALVSWLILALALFIPEPVYADDCARDPLNAADCMRTGGFRQGITMVVGGAATAGVVLSNILTSTAGGLPQPGVRLTDSPIAPPQGPEVLPPGMDEWHRKWLERGWRWSEEDGGFVPRPGAVSEDGKIWYRPPWDQGGEYWVDRDEFIDIQEHLRNGEEWSDTWGWQRPEDNRRMDAERARRWREFTDRDAGRRQHEQRMRDVRREVENDPEYQRMMRELDAIGERLRDMERQSLRDEINFNSRMAEIYERQDRNLGYIEAPVKVIKWTADTSIDILGGIPGPTRYIKYAYKGTTSFIDKSASTGSYTEGLKASIKTVVIEGVGDAIGDYVIKTPGIDLPESTKDIAVKTLVTKGGLSTTGKLGANLIKGKVIGAGVNDALSKKIITGPKLPGLPPVILAGM
jgi:hypothetical protein